MSAGLAQGLIVQLKGDGGLLVFKNASPCCLQPSWVTRSTGALQAGQIQTIRDISTKVDEPFPKQYTTFSNVREGSLYPLPNVPPYSRATRHSPEWLKSLCPLLVLFLLLFLGVLPALNTSLEPNHFLENLANLQWIDPTHYLILVSNLERQPPPSHNTNTTFNPPNLSTVCHTIL